MSRCEEHYRVLISGYLDGELSPADLEELEAHLAQCATCQREVDVMRRLFWGTTSAFAVRDLSEETWDRFMDNVYNRLERRAGWTIFLLGLAGLSLFGSYTFFMEPWTSALVKVLIATPIAGLAILFISVLRQRLESAKTDRYSREVHR
jgi:hypothetical protein